MQWSHWLPVQTSDSNLPQHLGPPLLLFGEFCCWSGSSGAHLVNDWALSLSLGAKPWSWAPCLSCFLPCSSGLKCQLWSSAQFHSPRNSTDMSQATLGQHHACIVVSLIPGVFGPVVTLAGAPWCWPAHQDIYPVIPSTVLRMSLRPSCQCACLTLFTVFCFWVWVMAQLLLWFHSHERGMWWWEIKDAQHGQSAAGDECSGPARRPVWLEPKGRIAQRRCWMPGWSIPIEHNDWITGHHETPWWCAQTDGEGLEFAIRQNWVWVLDLLHATARPGNFCFMSQSFLAIK